MRLRLSNVKLSRLAWFAAGSLLVITVILSAFGVRNSPLTCPLNYIANTDTMVCISPTNPADAPSTFVRIPLEVDHRWSDRGLILGVGLLGGVILVGLGLRLATSEPGPSESSDPDAESTTSRSGGRPRRKRSFLAVGIVAFAVGSAVWFVDTVARASGPTIERWTNVATGEVANLDVSGPYESRSNCTTPEATDSIFWNGWLYVQAWTGDAQRVIGPFRADATLPGDASFTGWQRGDRQLWTGPDDPAFGAASYIYLVQPGRVERWPRAGFTCID